MQRKKTKFPKDVDMSPQLMPFQEKFKNFLPNPMDGFAPTGRFSTGIDAAKAAFPIFGGSPTDTDTESPPAEADAADPPATTTDSKTPGGDSAKPEPDVAGMKPEEIAELLKNVGDLTAKVSQLTTENNTYKSKEQTAERAKLGREQQLEADLTDAQKTIAQMDAVIRHTAVVNAIQGAKDMEFHSARHVLNELAMDAFDIDVDLENGSATVTGIEGELKRIAKECPWLVSKDKTHSPAGTQTKPPSRGSGAPPASPGGDNTKQTKRADLINKYPVIAHGRAG